jgi:hypothetical protein
MNNGLKELLKERQKTKTIQFKGLDLEIRRLRADELKKSDTLLFDQIKDPEVIKKLMKKLTEQKDIINDDDLDNDKLASKVDISELLEDFDDISILTSFQLEKDAYICLHGMVEDCSREDLLTVFSDKELSELANLIISYTNA